MERRTAARHPTQEFNIRIGLPIIDRAHVALVRQLDELNANQDAYPGSEAFSEILSHIGRQIQAHFDSEEEILRGCGMPEAMVREHVQAHTDIIEQYSRLNLQLMTGRFPSREEALTLVRDWIVDHVLNHDVKIVDYLQGVAPAVSLES